MLNRQVRMMGNRENELRGHYCDGYKKGRAAANNNAAMLDQQRKHGYLMQGFADGSRRDPKGTAPVQNHYERGYRLGKIAVDGCESQGLLEAENEVAWREGFVDGYRGLDKGQPSALAKQ